MNTPSATAPPLDLTESAAGEEDPGAALDLPVKPTGPGDDACPSCGGTGKLAGRDCPMCHGTGKRARA
jgi:hypothetical protein